MIASWTFRRWPALRHRVAVAGLALSLPGGASAQGTPEPSPPEIVETSLTLEDGTVVRYGLALPADYDRSEADPRPLVLALHPGGRYAYFGSEFKQTTVEPALRSWGAVVVAPDVPDRSWATPASERAVLALLDHVVEEHTIDRSHVVVTGFSMGGRGTWYLTARHPDWFAGAIVMAGSPGDGDLAGLGDTPVYLIHSPADEVVPFARAEGAYAALSVRDHPVELRVLPGAGHYQMWAYGPALRIAGEWIRERW